MNEYPTSSTGPESDSVGELSFLDLTPKQLASVLELAIAKAESDEGIELSAVPEDMDAYTQPVPQDPEAIIRHAGFRDVLYRFIPPDYEIIETPNRTYIRKVI